MPARIVAQVLRGESLRAGCGAVGAVDGLTARRRGAEGRGLPIAVGAPSMRGRIGRLRDSGMVALAGVALLAGAGLGLLLAAH